MTKILTRRTVLKASAGVAAAAIITSRGEASDWKPSANVRVIIPAAPGGLTDVMGRLFATHLQTAWGQTAVVENKSGGGGTIGTLDYIRQKQDGHVILIGNPGPNAVAYSIFRNLQYKADQLIPVSNLIRVPNIISAHPSVGIKSIPELIAYAKANPDKLAYGSSGVGQSPHLTAAWFSQLTGIKMIHLPFRGAGPLIAAGLGGEPPIIFDNLFPSLPQVLDGKLIGLAVTTPERTSLAPDLPTVAETVPSVLGKFDISSWFCVFYGQGTPPAAVASLNAQCKAFLENQDMKKRIADLGARPDYGTPEQFKTFIEAEIEKFAGIIKREGLQMDVN
jgi:tripartite-type tricarboxylate transporter receptor subunit TctC